MMTSEFNAMKFYKVCFFKNEIVINLMGVPHYLFYQRITNGSANCDLLQWIDIIVTGKGLCAGIGQFFKVF